jgi:enoyl-CoA hydratase
MTVGYTVEGAVAVVRIERPEVRNAVDGATATALAEAFRRFDEDEGLVAAVLTGAGGHFCSGADLRAVAEEGGSRLREAGDGPRGPTRLRLAKPVIAAVEGYAVAGGLELALWCDLRVAARDATFGVYCRRWGVPLVDGGTVRLPRLIGESRAMDMVLTGRPVDGEEAFRIGLANRLVVPGTAQDEAVALAASLAAFPQVCLRGDRRSLREQWALDLDEALRHETRIGLETVASGETRRGASRFAAGHGRGGDFEDL